MLHLSTSGPYGMVFEHLQNCFHPKDSTSGFFQLLQLCFHIAQGHISPWITHVFRMAHLLALTKPLDGIRPTTVREALCQFTSHALWLQFCVIFAWHISPCTNLEL